eukprot:TRINITY_DN1984_c0_g1_i1.p1 TRINITY_DN1984_c0_g1~~TRINITY_DN1984_c0_g1_i1.p1  ORF type:complete len:1250 (-),score=247.24 TRINITY_DN1984_c0_g1_i1:268-4017(-)
MASGQHAMHIFERQSILAQKFEPFDVTSTKDLFIVASANGIISAYSATSATNQTENRLLHRFQTVQPYLLCVRYNPFTDTIITLEREVEEHSRQAVRVYSNWRVGTPSPIPIAVQDTSVVPEGVPQSAAHIVGFVPVLGDSSKPSQPTPRAFTLPMSMSATAIAVCQLSATIAVACQKIITVWSLYSQTVALKKKTPNANDDASSTTLPVNAARSSVYSRTMLRTQVSFTPKSVRNDAPTKKPDSEEKVIITKARPVFDVETSWEVKCLALSSKWLAYASQDQVRIYRYQISDNGADVEDDYATSTEISFLPGEVRTSDKSSHVVRDSYCFECEFDTQGNSIIPINPDIIMRVPSIPGARAPRNSSFEYFGPVTDTDGGLRIYGRSQVQEFSLLVYRRLPTGSTVQSLWFIHDPCEASITRGLVSTEKQAFVYDLQNPRQLSTYTFLSESNMVIPGQFFLYNLSQSALEVYTMRWSSFATNEYVPAPFMLARQIFIGLISAAVVDDHILLLSKQLDEDSETYRYRRNTQGLKAPNSPSSLTPSGAGSYGSKKSLSRSPYGFFPQSFETQAGAQTSDDSAEPQAAGWNLYVLGHNQIPMIYNELVVASQAYKEVMPTRQHQMILEGFYLLQARLMILQHHERRTSQSASVDPRAIAHRVDVDTCTSLLRKCSAQLAAIYFASGDYQTSARYYAISDVTLGQVVDQYSSHVSGANDALIKYLNHVLFDASLQEYTDDSAEVADRVLNIYRQYAPKSLPSVILKSCLTNYNQQHALDIFENLVDILEEEKVPNRLHENSDDLERVIAEAKFVRGLLLLDLGAVHEAGINFESLDASMLSTLLLDYQSCLFAAEHEVAALSKTGSVGSLSSLTDLGTVAEPISAAVEELTETDVVPPLSHILRKHTPWAFLDAIVRMAQSSGDWDEHFQLLLPRSEELFPSTSLLQECYLEAIILGLPGSMFDVAACQKILATRNAEFVYLQLLRLYVKRLLISDESDVDNKNLKSWFQMTAQGNQEHKPASEEAMDQKWMQFHLRAFSYYPEWFDGLEALPEKRPRVKENIYVRKILSLLVHVYQISSYAASLSAEDGTSLSIANVVQELSTKALAVLDSTASSFSGKWRASLLCLPIAGRLDEALGLVATKSMSSVLDFAKYCCHTAAEWKSVLNLLIECHEKNTGSKELATSARSSLCSTLDHLTRIMLPSEFLQILPKNGNLAFYLPYIQRAIQHNKALDIRRAIASDARKQAVVEEGI